MFKISTRFARASILLYRKLSVSDTKSIHKLRHNDSGVVLITVIILTIVLSVVTISIVSMNISQVTTSKSVVDTIRAEQLSSGAFFQQHQLRAEGCPASAGCTIPGNCDTCPDPADKVLSQTYSDGTAGNKTFTVNVTPVAEVCGDGFCTKNETDIGCPADCPGPCGTPNCSTQFDTVITY